MTKKLHQSQQEKVRTGFWLLSQSKLLHALLYLLILFLPTQFGKHFWPNFAFVFGLRMDYLSPTIYLTDMLILLIIIFSLPELKLFVSRTSKKILAVCGLLALSLFIGVVWSRNPPAGFYGIFKLVEYFFLTLAISINFKNLNKTVLFSCFLIGIIFESTLSFLQYFNQGSIGGLFYFFGERNFTAQTPGIANASINGQLFLRPYATFSHPNVLACFLIVAMLYLLLLFKRKLQVYLSIGIILGTITLLLTLSRSGVFLWTVYLIVLFGIPFAKKYKNKFSKTRFFAVIAMFFVLMVSIYVFFQNSFILQRVLLTKISEEALAQRTELIQQSVTMFVSNPIFGVGINNFFNNLSIAGAQQIALLIQPVHNIFLLVLSETGIIGFCMFIFLFYVCLKQLIKTKFTKERKYLLTLIFAVIFLGSFDHYFLTLQQGQILLALILGTVFSYRKA